MLYVCSVPGLRAWESLHVSVQAVLGLLLGFPRLQTAGTTALISEIYKFLDFNYVASMAPFRSQYLKATLCSSHPTSIRPGNLTKEVSSSLKHHLVWPIAFP